MAIVEWEDMVPQEVSTAVEVMEAAMVGMEVVWEVMVALAYDLVKLN